MERASWIYVDVVTSGVLHSADADAIRFHLVADLADLAGVELNNTTADRVEAHGLAVNVLPLQRGALLDGLSIETNISVLVNEDLVTSASTRSHNTENLSACLAPWEVLGVNGDIISDKDTIVVVELADVSVLDTLATANGHLVVRIAPHALVRLIEEVLVVLVLRHMRGSPADSTASASHASAGAAMNLSRGALHTAAD